MYFNFAITIIISLALIFSGCGEDPGIIELMDGIEIIEIHSKKVRHERYAVSVLVFSTFQDSCVGHHETFHHKPEANTFTIKMTKSTYTGSEDCLTAVHNYYEVIFLGILSPGEYILNLNGGETMFQVPAT